MTSSRTRRVIIMMILFWWLGMDILDNFHWETPPYNTKSIHKQVEHCFALTRCYKGALEQTPNQTRRGLVCLPSSMRVLATSYSSPSRRASSFETFASWSPLVFGQNMPPTT
jgi:hypothetical protein